MLLFTLDAHASSASKLRLNWIPISPLPYTEANSYPIIAIFLKLLSKELEYIIIKVDIVRMIIIDALDSSHECS